MLVDDNYDDNFFHEREIKKSNAETTVITKTSGIEALKYLKAENNDHLDLIFLDINMPSMNGWEFLKEYDKIDKGKQGKAIIIMLTTSDNSNDVNKAKAFPFVSDYITKPLTREKLSEVLQKFF